MANATLWVLASVWGTPPGAGLPTQVTERFAGEPPGALVQRIQADLGFFVSFAPAHPPREIRWQVSHPAANRTVSSDVGTGLAVTQNYQWLDGAQGLLIRTSLANRGKMPIELEQVVPVDWRFRSAGGPDGLRFRPLAYRNDVWYGSTYWTGPDWTRVGRNWHHPGEKTPSVRRFTAPRDGRVSIGGPVRKAHLEGDGVRVWIEHAGKVVWQAEIEGKDGTGVEPQLALDVRKGDTLRFVVHKRGEIYCDTTWWDPVLTYADGRRHQASAGFSTRQGNQGWYYEMPADGQPPKVARAVTIANDGFLLEDVLAPGRNVAHADTLPIGLIADAEDESGVVAVLLGSGPPGISVAAAKDGTLRLRVRAGASGHSLKPGEEVHCEPVFIGVYRGSWLKGLRQIDRLAAGAGRDPDRGVLRKRIRQMFEVLAAGGHQGGEPIELEYWAMIQSDWRRADQFEGASPWFGVALERQLEQTRQLLADLAPGMAGAEWLLPAAEESPRGGQANASGPPPQPSPTLANVRGGREFGVRLARLAEAAARPGLTDWDRRSLYLKLRWLKRDIALANPLMQFGPLLFTKQVPTSYSHLVMQYFGWRARPGGGVFVLERPGRSLACRDLFDGRLETGSVLEPRLSYDARRLAFSFVQCRGAYEPGRLDNESDDGFYHVWTANADGTSLRQITFGPYDDLMPTWLPDGGIAFSSTRRRGYARCFGAQFSPRWHVYTIHRMDGDGGSVRTLSYHDTNEWFPTVSPTGEILYARWDYIDRDAVTHQNLWSMRPDGTNPQAVWGNGTPSPHCTFQAQPIPGSHKIVFVASAHHSITAGSIAVLDPRAGKDGLQAVRRITPEVPFPEAEGMNIPEYYAAPWPLSEKYFLVAYSPKPLVWEPGANDADALGIYLLDAFGNRELLYRDPEIGSTSPCPLAPRPAPPALADTRDRGLGAEGELAILDIYQGLGDVPRGSIKELRVVQIFPKTTHVAGAPPVGLAGEENARAILGTVPVEPDGSAKFLVPARRPILFQALDADGFAYQTMRSLTYVQPGERLTCVGCHEYPLAAPGNGQAAALGRPAARLEPGALGGRPFSFVEVVQPILDRHCAGCHAGGKPAGGIDLSRTVAGTFTRSYVALCGDVSFWGSGTSLENAARALVPRFGARNQIQVTPPGGAYGARGSRLIKLLKAGHEGVRLTDDEFRRLGAWIDLNAVFYGVNEPAEQARQLRGEVVEMPSVQ